MTNAAGEQVEGNLYDIDLENRCFILEDRTGKAFIKIFWSLQHEKDTKILKQQKGWFVAPLVEMEELSVSGGMKEAKLIGLPWKERPADFPRPQKKGGFSGGGRPYQPRNERIIVLQCCMKVAADVWISGSDKTLKYEEVMAKITAEGIKAAGELCKAGGVQ